MKKHDPHRLTPLATALVTAFASTAGAQTTLPEVKVQDTVQNDYLPAKSTIGGKAPAELRDIPQSITIINRSVLDSQAAVSITDALRNVPGITISAGEGGVIGDNINLRGFSARTDVFLDGMRDRGQYSRDTFFLESVEVLKGPSSMLFGRGSTGGVINQVSKKADLKQRGEASVNVGTDDFYRATADYNRPLSKESAFRIEALAHDSKSTRDVTETQRYGVAPSLRLGIGTPTEIVLSALIQRNRDLPDYGVPMFFGKPLDVSANKFYGFTTDKFNQDINVFNATIEHKINASLTLRNQTLYGSYLTDAAPTPLKTVATPSATTAGFDTKDRKLHDSTVYNQTDLIAKVPMGSMLHTITTGFEIGQDDSKNESYTWSGLGNVNLYNPSYGPPPASATRVLNTVTDTTGKTLAAYINDQIDLNKQWKLIGGLRWDRFRADSDQLTVATGVHAQQGRTDRMLSTRAGVIWQPSDTQSYYLSYGTSFNPSAETVAFGSSTSSTPATLAPEKNRSYEIGAKFDALDGNLMFNTALFQVDKTNARTKDPATNLFNLDGDTRVRGFELGLVGRISKAWQVIAGYTFLDGRIVKSSELSSSTVSNTNPVANVAAQGKTLPNTPRNTLSLWTTYKFAEAWEAGGGAIYSSKRYVNNFETASIDGYTRFDATLAYVQKNYDVRLNLQNLTDKKYYETASASRATPAKGRSVLLTLTQRF